MNSKIMEIKSPPMRTILFRATSWSPTLLTIMMLNFQREKHSSLVFRPKISEISSKLIRNSNYIKKNWNDFLFWRLQNFEYACEKLNNILRNLRIFQMFYEWLSENINSCKDYYELIYLIRALCSVTYSHLICCCCSTLKLQTATH